MKQFALYLCLFLVACSNPTETKKPSQAPSSTRPYISQVNQKEFTTKHAYGELEKDELYYDYTETFIADGILEKSITSFGYNEELKHASWLFDTLVYTSKIKKNHIDYFIDGELSEKEVHKGNWVYVYDISSPEIPMLVRQHDTLGNILLEASIDEESIFQREFEILKKDKNGFAITCISKWKELKPNDNADLNNYSSKGLTLIDSTSFIVDFEYVSSTQ